MKRNDLIAPVAVMFGLILTGCQDAPETARHIGYVEAEWRYVTAPSAGRIVEIDVDKGSEIEVGDALFALDDTAEQASVAQAEALIGQAEGQAQNLKTGARASEIDVLKAQLGQAEAQLEEVTNELVRYKALQNDGYAPQSRVDALEAEEKVAKAAVKAAKDQIAAARLPGREGQRVAADAATQAALAQLDAAQFRLDERRVSSMVSGRVEEVFYRAGEYVVPGTPVLSVLPEDGLKVRFFVPEAELPKVSLGRKVKITADGLARPLGAEVTFIAHQAEYTPPVLYSRQNRNKLVFMVEADIPSGQGFVPGLPVEVDWQ